MKEELNLYEILKYAPKGIKLFTPKFGWLYLHTVSDDNYRNGWLGNDKAIKLTKKPPKFSRNSINISYAYDDIDYCFDEYGHFYATDPDGFYPKPDSVFLEKGVAYRYNGRKFHTLDCQIFPDEELTWNNWQKKLFMPGDMIVIPVHDGPKYYPWTEENVPTSEVIFTGTIKDIPKSGGVYLVDIAIERIEGNNHSHDFIDYGAKRFLLQNARFAGHQDWIEWCSTKEWYYKKLKNVKI